MCTQPNPRWKDSERLVLVTCTQPNPRWNDSERDGCLQHVPSLILDGTIQRGMGACNVYPA